MGGVTVSIYVISYYIVGLYNYSICIDNFIFILFFITIFIFMIKLEFCPWSRDHTQEKREIYLYGCDKKL